MCPYRRRVVWPSMQPVVRPQRTGPGPFQGRLGDNPAPTYTPGMRRKTHLQQQNGILKTFFLTMWPNYLTNRNHLNKFGRWPPRDHSHFKSLVKIQWAFSEEKMSTWKCWSMTQQQIKGQRPVTQKHDTDRQRTKTLSTMCLIMTRA